MKIFGFVYIWRDRYRKKFCVGSHYGQLDDGYITSTGYMIRAYNKRPQDFRRRILFLLTEDNKKLLLEKEQYFLNFIRSEELGKKYYNLKKHASGGNGRANLGKSKKAWNEGLTKEMYLLRKDGLFSLLCDKPKPIKKSRGWTTEQRLELSKKLKLSWEDPSSNYKSCNLYDINSNPENRIKSIKARWPSKVSV